VIHRLFKSQTISVNEKWQTSYHCYEEAFIIYITLPEKGINYNDLLQYHMRETDIVFDPDIFIELSAICFV